MPAGSDDLPALSANSAPPSSGVKPPGDLESVTTSPGWLLCLPRHKSRQRMDIKQTENLLIRKTCCKRPMINRGVTRRDLNHLHFPVFLNPTRFVSSIQSRLHLHMWRLHQLPFHHTPETGIGFSVTPIPTRLHRHSHRPLFSCEKIRGWIIKKSMTTHKGMSNTTLSLHRKHKWQIDPFVGTLGGF